MGGVFFVGSCRQDVKRPSCQRGSMYDGWKEVKAGTDFGVSVFPLITLLAMAFAVAGVNVCVCLYAAEN